MIFIWFMFELGQIVHVLARVEMIVRAKNNAATSRDAVLKAGAITFLIRMFICMLGFGIFLSGEAPNIMIALKMEPWAWLSALSAVMNSAAGPFVAGAFGYSLDSLLEFIPGLKAYIPSDIPAATIADVKETVPVPGGIQTTTQHTEVVTTPVVPKKDA